MRRRKTLEWGKYTSGPVQAEFLPDGRRMFLLRDFSYLAPDNVDWIAPEYCIFDGASIPMPFWSIIGGPFEGKYRDASVLHDFACCAQTRTWQSVHRLFYTAMRCSGVGWLRGKTMYYAVWVGGPRWIKLNTAPPAKCLRKPPTPSVDQRTADQIFRQLRRILSSRLVTNEEARVILRAVAPGVEDRPELIHMVIIHLLSEEPSSYVKRLIALSILLSQQFSEEHVRSIYEWVRAEKPTLEQIEERAESARSHAQYRQPGNTVFPEIHVDDTDI